MCGDMHVQGTHRSRKKAWDCLEPELQAHMCCPMLTLGSELPSLWPSSNFSNCWDITPVSNLLCSYRVCYLFSFICGNSQNQLDTIFDIFIGKMFYVVSQFSSNFLVSCGSILESKVLYYFWFLCVDLILKNFAEPGPLGFSV